MDETILIKTTSGDIEIQYSPGQGDGIIRIESDPYNYYDFRLHIFVQAEDLPKLIRGLTELESRIAPE